MSLRSEAVSPTHTVDDRETASESFKLSNADDDCKATTPRVTDARSSHHGERSGTPLSGDEYEDDVRSSVLVPDSIFDGGALLSNYAKEEEEDDDDVPSSISPPRLVSTPPLGDLKSHREAVKRIADLNAEKKYR